MLAPVIMNLVNDSDPVDTSPSVLFLLHVVPEETVQPAMPVDPYKYSFPYSISQLMEGYGTNDQINC